MKIKSMLVLFIIALGALQNASACGCGIAISDIKVFNSLKETQAYLLIDVKDQTTYNEMPFFRLISMDKPHNVTIVFPIDQIPYDVEGKKITAEEFLETYRINTAEKAAKEQDFSELINITKEPLFLMANGLVSSYILDSIRELSTPIGERPLLGGPFAAEPISPVAHFEFEGGSLDIYNVSTMQTLEEFVKTINITLTDKVKELVTKYNNYYVAVLYLKVSGVINENDIDFLENCMAPGLERIKNELAEKTEFADREIQQMVEREISSSTCGSRGSGILRSYIYGALYASENLDGTLVTMKFKNSNFFYPTSVVGSYKYPIKDQRYYVKVPDNLHIKLSSSEISKTANFNGERWYKIESTEEDLKGTIVGADFSVKLQDTTRNLISVLYNNIEPFIFGVYIAVLALPLLFWKRSEKITSNETGLAIVAYLFGGLLLSGIGMLFRKKKRLAFTLFGIWLLLFIIRMS